MDVMQRRRELLGMQTSLLPKEYDSVEFYAPNGFRVYAAYIKKSGIYIRNLIPCVRKSDNKPGMYDTVTKTFYTNAGTGEFIVPN